MRTLFFSGLTFLAGLLVSAPGAWASQFAFVNEAETLPAGATQIQHELKVRHDKGKGNYVAFNNRTTIEYGVTSRFSIRGGVRLQSIDSSGLLVDGYLPGDESYELRFAGFDARGKYKFLNTAEHFIGLSGHLEVDYLMKDPHSGLDKEYWALETGLNAQKYFLEGQLVWAGNLGLKAARARRGHLSRSRKMSLCEARGAPEGHESCGAFFSARDEEWNALTRAEAAEWADPFDDVFEWPTFAEMEIEYKIATGLSYRFANNWYVSAELLYEEEYETEVDRERHSVFVGPGLHYEGQRWGMSVGYMRQIEGGDELVEPGDDLHLVEKTKNEFMLKVSYNF